MWSWPNMIYYAGIHLHAARIQGQPSSQDSESQGQSYFTTGRLPPVRLREKPLETHHRSYSFNWILVVVVLTLTSAQTRGWVCRLQWLLVLASAVILRSESRGTNDRVLLSQIRDSPNLVGQVPVFISPRNRVARLYTHVLGSSQNSSTWVEIMPGTSAFQYRSQMGLRYIWYVGHVTAQFMAASENGVRTRIAINYD
jgi:hypothetical protein